MKKSIFAILAVGLLSACQNTDSKVIDRTTYKQILKEVMLANLIEKKLNQNDSLQKNIKWLVYKKHNVDSTLLKKTTDYYSQHPDKLHKIYSEIYTEFKQKSDSLEKLAPLQKPKNDKIRIDKKNFDVLNIKKKQP